MYITLLDTSVGKHVLAECIKGINWSAGGSHGSFDLSSPFTA